MCSKKARGKDKKDNPNNTECKKREKDNSNMAVVGELTKKKKKIGANVFRWKIQIMGSLNG